MAGAQPQTEAETAWSEVQRSSAEALASQDCRVACRALESLGRATKRLCDIGPEHCEEARAKLKDATQRVRTTCPECEVQTIEGPKTNAPPPDQMRPTMQGDRGGGTDTVASEAAPQKGGCASCSTSSGADPSAFGLVTLLALLLRRKKTRRV